MTKQDPTMKMSNSASPRFVEQVLQIEKLNLNAQLIAGIYSSTAYHLIQTPEREIRRSAVRKEVQKIPQVGGFDYESVLAGIFPQEDAEGHGFVCNRGYNNRHVQGLIESFVETFEASVQDGTGNMSENFPILLALNDDKQTMKIVDGQHRFLACKALHEGQAGKQFLTYKGRFPFYFTLSSAHNIGMRQIAGLNSHAKNWELFDFVKGCAAEGNVHYRKLLAYLIYFGVQATSFQRNYSTGDKSRLPYKGDIKEGSFEITDEEGMLQMLQRSHRFVEIVNKFYRDPNRSQEDMESGKKVRQWKLGMTYRLTQSLNHIWNIPNFNEEHFMHQVKLAALKGSPDIRKLSSVDANLAAPIMALYNNHLKHKRHEHCMTVRVTGIRSHMLMSDLEVTAAEPPARRAIKL